MKGKKILHFLTGKLDQTGFPHPSMVIWFTGHVMWESTCKKQQSWKFNLPVKYKRECVLIVFNVQLVSVLKDFCSFWSFLIFPIRSINSKKKIWPIQNVPDGQYNNGIVKWSSALFFHCWFYLIYHTNINQLHNFREAKKNL